ncbi:MAG: histidine phosphatase family protein [Firmicutes bacterium]|nr:histidine phosphatase family protein [Bacillota bacterium]
MIYAIRHGESDANARGERNGWTHDMLTTKGIRQAKERAIDPKIKHIDHIYSSDLPRAYNTATEIDDVLNIGITVDWRLREFSGPRDKWPEEIKQERDTKESWQEAFDRAKGYWKWVIQEGIDNVAIVTHGGFMIMLQYCLEYERFLGKEHFLDYMTNFNLSNAAVMEFDLYGQAKAKDLAFPEK